MVIIIIIGIIKTFFKYLFSVGLNFFFNFPQKQFRVRPRQTLHGAHIILSGVRTSDGMQI